MPDWREAVRARLAGAPLEPGRAREMVEEIANHLEDRHAELLASGMPAAVAEEVVRAELEPGGALGARLAEVAPAAGRPAPVTGAGAANGEALAGLCNDLRYAVRALRDNRGFTLITLLSLALGIGANSAIFHLLESLHLRELPVGAPEELALVRFRNWAGGGGSFGAHPDLSHPLWERLRERQQAFSEMLAWGDRDFDSATGGEARKVRALMVSGDFLRVLRVVPVLGRTFTAAEDVRGCFDPGALLSHGYWQRELGGDPAAVGRRLTLDGHAVTVIGVTPPSFFGMEVGRAFDLLLPLCLDARLRGPRTGLDAPGSWWLSAVGRLRPGWTIAGASAHFEALSPALVEETMPPYYRGRELERHRTYRLNAYPAATGISALRARYSTPLYLLLGIAGLVLLIACTNLTNFLLARAGAREREVAVRLALGASRGRLIRQLMTESLLLAALGAALGLLLARGLAQFLLTFLSSRNDRVVVPLTPDWRVLAFTVGLAALTCLLFGLAPALRASGADVGLVLKAAAGRTSTAGRARFGLRRMLVALQVGLSFVLLFGALLFARSLRNLVTTDPGFRDRGVMIVRVDIRPLNLAPEGRAPFTRELLARIRSTPGVTEAAISDIVPISGNGWTGLVRLPGSNQGPAFRSQFNAIGPRFLATMGIELVAGRDLGDGDGVGAPRVAIVNEQLTRKLGPAAGRVGGRFLAATGPKDDHLYEIVGIVRGSKYTTLREGFEPTAFLALAQKSDQGPRIAMLVHGAISAASLTGAVKATITGYAPAAIIELDGIERLLRQSTLTERLMATLAGFFGLLAALLAAVGLYGVISYGVVSRSRELGIRMALGAGAGRVMRMIVRDALELLAIGLVAGVALGLVAARAAGALLYGLEPHDPLTVFLTAAMLAIIALAASLLPARRAARADPMLTLRDE